uniref:(northern house mosquito) hypothetical protein n=1 Tax=Culex pipiens TaxID=7175 RepID=A0A8D8AML0_CULPI
MIPIHPNSRAIVLRRASVSYANRRQLSRCRFPGCPDERQMVEPAGGPPVRPWYGTRTGTTRKISVTIQSLFSLAISTPHEPPKLFNEEATSRYNPKYDRFVPLPTFNDESSNVGETAERGNQQFRIGDGRRSEPAE